MTKAKILSLTDESELVNRARKEPAVFGSLYQRYHRRVYAYHLARTANVQDAQDLTSVTFLSAFESLAGYRGTGSFAAWLFGIAARKNADYFRTRRPQYPLESAENLADFFPTIDEIIEGKSRILEMGRAMRRLAPERTEALVLRVFSQLSVAETAQVMGKTEAAVKMLTHRALGDLRQILSVELQEEL